MPVDWLIAGAIGYGVKKYRDHKKEKKEWRREMLNNRSRTPPPAYHPPPQVIERIVYRDAPVEQPKPDMQALAAMFAEYMNNNNTGNANEDPKRTKLNEQLRNQQNAREPKWKTTAKGPRREVPNSSETRANFNYEKYGGRSGYGQRSRGNA